MGPPGLLRARVLIAGLRALTLCFCLLSPAVTPARQLPPAAPAMSFFITSVGRGFGADLGGLAGADAHCQQIAGAVGYGRACGVRISVPLRQPAGPRSTPAIGLARDHGRTQPGCRSHPASQTCTATERNRSRHGPEREGQRDCPWPPRHSHRQRRRRHAGRWRRGHYVPWMDQPRGGPSHARPSQPQRRR